jgi:flagellar hook-length control protein FliK
MPAPPILSSQTPVLDTAAPVTVLAPAGSPFDAILMLEELAASMVPVDAAGIDAGAAELDSEVPESFDELDGEDSIEDADEESEDLLAFLTGMIAAAPPPPQGRNASADAGSSGEGGDLTAGGEATKGHPAKAPAWPLSTEPSTSTVADPDPASTPNQSRTPVPTPAPRNDAEAAVRAFASMTQPEPVRASDEAGPSARATDFLTHAPRTASAHAPEQTAVAAHVRDPRWAEEFGTRIVTLVNQRESIASISLNPVDLGPVDVSVTVKDTQATIHFGAAQADTRALIEASLPRLRELLAAQGFQLMDASVSQGFTRQSRPDSASIPRPATVEDVTPATQTVSRVVGLLDTYA